MAHTITLIPGDGIGPEVADATRRAPERGLLSTFQAGVRTFALGGKVGTEGFTRTLRDALGRA